MNYAKRLAFHSMAEGEGDASKKHPLTKGTNTSQLKSIPHPPRVRNYSMTIPIPKESNIIIFRSDCGEERNRKMKGSMNKTQFLFTE